MTERGLYEALLFELRKSKAPHIHLEEFIYFSNKGIQEYVNEMYNVFETTAQTSDALAALTSYVDYNVTYVAGVPRAVMSGNSITTSAPIILTYGQRYNSRYLQIPAAGDYFHLLNCVVDTKTKFNFKCYTAGYIFSYAAAKFTADSASGAQSNAWLRPVHDRPYYKELDHNNSLVTGDVSTTPDFQIFYGSSNRFDVDKVYCEYLRQPRAITLTENMLDLPSDTSSVMEFPPYVCNEIIKRLVKLVMENAKDPRLQTFIPTNSSVK
jgi:hypothetical protein